MAALIPVKRLDFYIKHEEELLSEHSRKKVFEIASDLESVGLHARRQSPTAAANAP